MTENPRVSLKLMGVLLAVFALLGLADLFLTWRLIQGSDGQVLESNPLANWWLTTYGWAGLTAFKLGLVTLIGGLTIALAWHGRQAGTLLLVFACGAQSAIVLDSVFLARMSDTDGTSADVVWTGMPDNMLFRWLTEPSVQKELALSSDHVQGIAELTNERRALPQAAGRLSRAEWNAKIEELLAHEQEFLDGLEPWQTTRLQQIAWQQRGARVFFDPHVAELLELTPAQDAALHAIIDQAHRPRSNHNRRRQGAGASAKVDPSRSLQDRVTAVLTTEQAAKWKELIGQPFPVEAIHSFLE